MAIAFIPVRDQAQIISSSKENTKNKGNVLKKIASGKSISTPTDDTSIYTKISTMKMSIDSYTSSIKELSVHRSTLDIAASATQQLANAYKVLADRLQEAVDHNALPTPDATNANFLKNNINSSINAINSILNTTKFLNKNVFTNTVMTDVGKLSVSDIQVGGYASIKVDLNTTGMFFDGATNIASVATDRIQIKYNAMASATNISTSDVTVAKNSSTTAMNNYKLIVSGIIALETTEEIAQVQKTNTEAALSSIENIDIMEEMVNLMNAQVLEELSSEAMIKIKESVKYVLRLIQS